MKTGTSKEMRDNWCIGYSQRYTVGVWVGNFSGQPMRDVSGVFGATPVWLEVMNQLHGAAPRRPRHRLPRRGVRCIKCVRHWQRPAAGVMDLAIFDIDGTLANTNPADARCYVRAVAEVLGVDLSAATWSDFTHVTPA